MSEELIAAIEAPRATARLVGHGEAERAFLEAWRGGRLAHGWLIGGPRGIGKATFAWRCARFALAGGRGATLDMAPDDRVFRQVAAGSHPGLRLVRRSYNQTVSPPRFRTEIAVEDVRALQPFFRQTAAGWRVAVIDAADDMNPNAANALLKLLEEPPARSLILIVSHAPGRLLATLRSRCRRLALRPLSEAEACSVIAAERPELPPDEVAALARLAPGCPGQALALADRGGLALHRELEGLLSTLPTLDLVRLHALAERCGASGEGEATFAVLMRLLGDWLRDLVREAAGAPRAAESAAGDTALRARLAQARSLEAWLGVWDKTRSLVARADGLALDRKQVLLNAFFAVAGA